MLHNFIEVVTCIYVCVKYVTVLNLNELATLYVDIIDSHGQDQNELCTVKYSSYIYIAIFLLLPKKELIQVE